VFDKLSNKSTIKYLDSVNADYELGTSGQIISVSISRNADNVLKKLRPFKLLKDIRFYPGHGLSDAGIQYLKQAVDLESLDLNCCLSNRISPDAFSFFAVLHNLQKLSISYDGDGDAVMPYLVRAAELRSLRLFGNFSSNGLQYLSNLSNLEKLYLDGIMASDASMPHIAKLKNLTLIDLKYSPIHDKGIAEIGNLKKVKSLCLSGTKITDKGIDAISGFSHLRLLALERTRISDESLRSIRGFHKLETLLLDKTNITDDGLKQLYHLEKLNLISLLGTKVTGKGNRSQSGEQFYQ
jgi:internalin A